MGYYLRAINAGDRAARSLGVPVLRYKLYALMLSAGLHRRLAGSLYAVMVGFVDPDSVFGILVSVKMVIMRAALGAPARCSARSSARSLLVPLRGMRRTRSSADRRPGVTYIVYGAIIMLIARFAPGGLVEIRTPSARAPGPPAAGWCAVLLEATDIVRTFGRLRAVDGASLSLGRARSSG